MGQQTAPDLSSRKIPETRHRELSTLRPSLDGISGHSKFRKTSLPLRSPTKTLTSLARTIPSETIKHEDLEDTGYKRGSHHALPQEVIKDGFFVGSIDFEKYQISMAPIAEGSQAVVYQIKHKNSGVAYALKVLKAKIAQDPAERAAFEREVNLLARLKHDHINGIVGVGVLPGTNSYCAMLELVETTLTDALKLNVVGKSLLTRTYVRSSWCNKDRFRICCEIASAVNYLHSRGAIRNSVVVHRDLKPDNVGITSARRCLLLDFGLAVALRVEGSVNDEDTYEMTGLTGSRRYMAPEVCKKQPYGIPVDVYSLALVVWEVLALKGKPYDGFDPQAHSKLVVDGSVRPKIPKSWNAQLKSLLASAWSGDPAERPTSEDMYHQLTSMFGGYEKKRDPCSSTSLEAFFGECLPCNSSQKIQD